MLSFLSKFDKETMKKSRLGNYITIRVPGEPYKAYIPPKLPPDPPLKLGHLYPQIDRATQAISELNTIAKTIPNTSLFIYMYVRKEALLSSQIEGTQSSLSDLILFEHHEKPNVSIEDVEEVSNYVVALKHGLKRLSNGFPLCLRLIKEIHSILLQGGRGSKKLPGEFRRSQNWIGGTRPGNALFVPPPAEHLPGVLQDFENFLNNENSRLPILIRAALVHVQFESIHPFLDGNGRIGRLLIILLLCENGLLSEPILYLSLYLKENRNLYYQLLQEVRTNGTWETWVEFFLKGIESTAKQASMTVLKMNRLFETDLSKINKLGRAKHSCNLTLEVLKKIPQVSVQLLAKELKVSAPTARKSLNHLLELGITQEISGHQRNKIYVYKKYLNLLEKGTSPVL